MLRRIGIIAVLGLIVAALTAVPALAAKQTGSGIHYQEEPTCTYSVTTANNGKTTATLVCTGGEVAGVGSDPLFVFYDAVGGCATSGNGNQPGGHVQSTADFVTPNGGHIFLEDATISVRCPGGLEPAFIDISSVELVLTSADNPNKVLKRLPVDNITVV